MSKDPLLEPDPSLPVSRFDIYRLGLAGDRKAEIVITRQYPRFKAIIRAYNQALKLSEVPTHAKNVAPCRQVALHAAQDLTDRIIGRPTEHVEVVNSIAQFQANLSVVIQLEAKLNEINSVIDLPKSPIHRKLTDVD